MADSGAKPPDQAKPPAGSPDQLTWKDLAEFAGKQAENTRTVIDYWFKLAAQLLGFVLVVVVAVIGIVGWKTIADAKATAEATARETAKAKVEDILKQPDVQKLVRDTATALFEKGEFRKAIEGKVSELIAAEIATPESRKLIGEAIRGELTKRTAPRVLTEAQAKIITDSLRSAPPGRLFIQTGGLPEQQGYARKLLAAIKGSPSWKDHVSYAEPGSLAGMTNNRGLLLDGVVVVVDDIARAPESARMLEVALKNGSIAGVRIGLCECEEPPKPLDIWLYVGEKKY